MAKIRGFLQALRADRRFRSDFLDSLPAKDRLAGLSAKDRPAGLSAKDLLAGLTADELAAALQKLPLATRRKLAHQIGGPAPRRCAGVIGRLR